MWYYKRHMVSLYSSQLQLLPVTCSQVTLTTVPVGTGNVILETSCGVAVLISLPIVTGHLLTGTVANSSCWHWKCGQWHYVTSTAGPSGLTCQGWHGAFYPAVRIKVLGPAIKTLASLSATCTEDISIGNPTFSTSKFRLVEPNACTYYITKLTVFHFRLR